MAREEKDPAAANEDDDHDEADAKEQITAAIGGFGRWQLYKSLFVTFVIWTPASFHLLNMVFFRADTNFWCSRPTLGLDWSVDTWKNISSPDGDACNVYDVNFDAFNSLEDIKNSPEYQTAVEAGSLRPCESWEFDRSFWRRTIIQEWGLVCAKTGIRKLTQQVTFFGLLCGVFASGVISDRFGRVPTMMALLLATVIFGTGTAFAPSYEAFLVGIWLCGFTTIGYGTVMYCWMMELLTGTAKTVFGCTPHLNFAVWGLVVALIAYLVPDWHHMELVFSIPLVLLICTYWILPESPRWLLAHGRLTEAEGILRRIADFNGQPLPKSFQLVATHHTHHRGRSVLGFLELFKTPNMRKKTLIQYYLWFATSVIYYGLTLNSNSFGASLFVYFSFGKAIEIPFVILVIFLLLKAGRRTTILLLYSMCGLCLLCTILVPPGQYKYEWPIVALNILGRGSSIGTLCLCYVYSAEIFPTVVRNVGIGTCSVWARIGPMLAPYIADLAHIEPRLPIVVFGAIAMFASFLVTFLPETTHHKLADTLEEGEALGRGDTLYSCLGQRWCGNRQNKTDKVANGV